MKKKILLLTLISAMAFSLASCGKNAEEHKSQITGDGAAATEKKSTAQPSATPAAADEAAMAAAKQSADSAKVDESYIASTIAPAGTPAPDSAQKAQAKINAEGGETNVTINNESGEQKVNLKFSLENHTGIDFPAMLLAPVDVELKDAPNVLGNQMFQNGMSLDLNPSLPDGTQLSTTLFNIVPVDANGRGYVFQNIDLSTSSVIQLYLDNGVPKAVIN